MTLQASGQITLNNIQTEHGGANPIKLHEYYKNGTYIKNYGPNTGMPTSGAISMSNFYSTRYIPEPTITFGGHVNSTSRTLSLGAAPADGNRIVYVATGSENDSGGQMTATPQINGSNANVVYRPNISDTTGHFWALVPTGTSCTISYSQYGGGGHVAWILTGVNTLEQGIEIGNTAFTFSGLANYPQCVVCCNRSRSSRGSQSFTTSGGWASSQSDGYFNAGVSHNHSLGYGHGITNGTGSNITGTLSGGGAGYAAVFRLT